MNPSLIVFVLFAVVVGVTTLWSIFRGLGKSRIRGITVLVSALGAVMITLAMRKHLASQELVDELLIPNLKNLMSSELVADLFGLSPTLNEVLLNCVSSLLMPLVCLGIFVLLCFVTWIIYLVLSLVFGAFWRVHNARAFLSMPRAAIWGFVQGVVIVLMLLLPFATYLEIAPPVIEEIVASDVLPAEAEDVVVEINETVVTPLNEGAFTVYRALGGGALCNALTDFKVGEAEVDFSEEIGTVASFGCNIVKLGKTPLAEYGHSEALVFVAIADSFGDSVLLPTIAGEVIYNATDSWLRDQAFLGVARPSLGEMGEILDPFLTVVLEILHEDARDREALQADIRTVAEMVSTFAEHGVFANFSNTEKLMSSLSSNGIIGNVISTLGKNNSMKRLIPEITNLGVRAIATTLGIPANVEEVYGDLLTDVANAVNIAKGMPEDQRAAYMTTQLTNAFDEAGVPVDAEILDCYSVSMIEDLIEGSDKAEITNADVQAFFEVYAMNAEELPPIPSGNSTEGVSGTKPLAGDDRFAGTVYAGKSDEELKSTGAAVLAEIYHALSTLDVTDPEQYTAQASAVLTEKYAAILPENSPSLSTIENVKLTEKPSEVSQQATASLKASSEMVTQKVVMEDLLVDSKTAMEAITDETIVQEAAAVEAIFSTVGDLQKQMNYGAELDLTQVAGSVGGILDSLGNTASFGSEKTADLFTAVLQSETVRQTADLDMKTATEMAKKATEGTPNYTQTMNAVSNSVSVITKLGKDGEEVTEAELIELIRNINPQTAGMIEVYVTAARIESYKVSPKYSGISAELISKTFHYMANAEMDEAQYEKEAKALNQVLSIALTARENTGSKHLFTKDGQTGVLPGTAAETVETFMSSNAIGSALCDTMLTDGAVREDRFDAFDLGAKLPSESNDRQDCVEALHNYYVEHNDDETRDTLRALAALLGVDASEVLN